MEETCQVQASTCQVSFETSFKSGYQKRHQACKMRKQAASRKAPTRQKTAKNFSQRTTTTTTREDPQVRSTQISKFACARSDCTTPNVIMIIVMLFCCSCCAPLSSLLQLSPSPSSLLMMRGLGVDATTPSETSEQLQTGEQLNESAALAALMPDYVIDDFVDSDAGAYPDTPPLLAQGGRDRDTAFSASSAAAAAAVARSIARRQAVDAEEAAVAAASSIDDLPRLETSSLVAPRPLAATFQDLEPISPASLNSAFSYPLANFYFDSQAPQAQHQATPQAFTRQHAGKQSRFLNLQDINGAAGQQQEDGHQPLEDELQPAAAAAAADKTQVASGSAQNSNSNNNKIGPTFTREPPSFLHYLNSSDLIIPCAASGQPAPTITWWQKSGQLKVGSLLDKRYVRYDNSLVISAFKAHEFEPEIHATSYRCQASNALGTIISRDVVINAVIDQEYEASVSDQFVTVDNDALFKCQLAPQVRDFHQVIGWLEDGQQLVSLSSATPSSPAGVFASATGRLVPASGGGGEVAADGANHMMPMATKRRQQQQQQRAIMLPDGQLYIQRIQLKDANKSYRCQIRNLLNGRLSSSTISGRLFVTDANESGASPRIIEGPRAITTARLGDQLLLTCVAQGSPRPTIRWFRWAAAGLGAESPNSISAGVGGGDDESWLELSAQTSPAQHGLSNSSAQQNQNQNQTSSSQPSNPPRHLLSSESNFLLIRTLLAGADQRAKFKCLANNSYGAHQLETELRLDLWPPSKLLELAPKRAFIREQLLVGALSGSSKLESESAKRPALVLNCSVRATASQPLIALEWLKNGRPLFSISLANFQSHLSHLSHQLSQGDQSSQEQQQQQQQRHHSQGQVADHLGLPWSLFDDPNQELILSEFDGTSSWLAQHQHQPQSAAGDHSTRNLNFESETSGELENAGDQQVQQMQMSADQQQQQQQAHVISTSSSLLKLSQQQDDSNNVTPAGGLQVSTTRIWQALKMTQQRDQLLYQLSFLTLKRSDRGSYQCRTKSLASSGGATSSTTASSASTAQTTSSDGWSQPLFAGGRHTQLPPPSEAPNGNLKVIISQQTSQLLLEDTPPKFVETFASSLVSSSSDHNRQQMQQQQQQQHVSLKCVASGSPLPEISWQLSGFPVPESSRFRVGDYVTRDGLIVSFVNISNVQPEDGGLYECMATNDVGQLRHASWLNVTGPAHIRAMPKVAAVAGGSLTIMCPVGGWPIEQISWFQNSTKLPANHRQKLFPNGTLIISDLNEVLDSGQYACQAKSAASSSVQGGGSGGGVSDHFAVQHVQVSIKVPPVVEPLAFAKSLHRGQRYNIMCTVTRGDLPVSIRWFKDGRQIEPTTAATSRSGGGNSNNNFVIEQDLAGGADSSSGLTRSVMDSTGGGGGGGLAIKQLDPYSSTLTFASLQSYHRGEYSCEATNEVGRANQSSSLVIHVPPEWTIEPNDLSVTIGRTAVIDCQAQGVPAARIEWRLSQDLYRDPPSEFKPIISSLYMRVFENGSLIIYNTQRTDAGYYLCQANNGVGPGISRVIKLTVHVAAHFKTKIRNELVRRGQPVRLKCESLGDPPIEISWLKDKQPLYSQEEPRYSLTKNALPDGILSELTIQEADRGDSALYTCITQNQFGNDDTNIQLIVQAPPDAPEELRAHDIEARSAKLTWLPGHSGNSPVIKYALTCAAVAQLSPGQASAVVSSLSVSAGTSGVGSSNHNQREQWTLNATIQGNESSFLLQNLVPLTEYHCHLVAVNALGSSRVPAQPPLKFSTSDEAPSLPPAFVKAHALSSRAIRVRWRAPERRLQNANNNQPQQQLQHFGQTAGFYVGYKLYRPTQVMNGASDGGQVGQATGIGAGNTGSNSHNNKQQDTGFVFKTIEFGAGPTTTSDLSPASASSNKSFVSQQLASVGEHECQLTGLRRGQKYLITVQPFNGRGTGPASEPILAETWRVDVPEPPSLRMIARTSHSIHLAWRLATPQLLSASAAKLPLKPSGGSANHHLQQQQQQEALRGEALTPEELAAEQAQASEPILGFILTRKQVPHVAPASSDMSSSSAANQQAVDGSLSAASADLQALHALQRPVEIRLPGDHMSQIVDNLTCGTRYQFTIAAINSVGASEPSEPLVLKTEGSLPVAPDRNSLLSLNASSLVINLAAWHNGACLMRSFDILFKPSRSRKWTTLTNYQIAPAGASAASTSGGGSAAAAGASKTSDNHLDQTARSLTASPRHEIERSSSAVNNRSSAATINNQQQQRSASGDNTAVAYQQQQQQRENGTIVLDDLASSVNYDLKILATNEAGTTEALYTFNTNGNSISSLAADQQWSTTGGEFRLSGADATFGDLFPGAQSLGATLLPLVLLFLLISLSLSTGCILFARRRHSSPSNSSSLSISSRSNQSSSNYCTTTTTTTAAAAGPTVTTGATLNGAGSPGLTGSAAEHFLAGAAYPKGGATTRLLAGSDSPLMSQQQQQMRLSDIYGTSHRAHLHQRPDKSHYAYLTAGRTTNGGHAHSGHHLRTASSPHSTDFTSMLNGCDGSGGGGGDDGDGEMCLGASALNISGGGNGEHAHQTSIMQRARQEQSYYASGGGGGGGLGGGELLGGKLAGQPSKSSTLPSSCHQQMAIQRLITQQQQQQQQQLLAEQADSSAASAADQQQQQQQQQTFMNSFMAANLMQQQQQHSQPSEVSNNDSGLEASEAATNEAAATAAAVAAYALQAAALQQANIQQQFVAEPQTLAAGGNNGAGEGGGDSFNLAANLSDLLEQQQQQQQRHHHLIQQVYATVKRGCPRLSAQQQRQALCDYTTIYQCPATTAAAAAAQQQQHQHNELMIGQCSCSLGGNGGSQMQEQQSSSFNNNNNNNNNPQTHEQQAQLQTQSGNQALGYHQQQPLQSEYQSLRQINS